MAFLFNKNKINAYRNKYKTYGPKLPSTHALV
jgi:hypothetical protein